jgi:hypothetical protein
MKTTIRTNQKDVAACMDRAQEMAKLLRDTQRLDSTVESSALIALASMTMAASLGLPTDNASLSILGRRIFAAVGKVIEEHSKGRSNK